MPQIKNLPEKLSRIKENDQDYEFYPTDEIMIRVIFNNLQNHKHKYQSYNKLLDIGAGDGNLFNIWNKLIDECFPRDEHGYRPNTMDVVSEYYAIEKSHILLEYLPKEVITIGTDFHTNTLIDKDMDVIFCNPPYSEYEAWAEKAILEANAHLLYLVIPQRWSNSFILKRALQRRGVEAEVIHSADFMDSPRSARAKVDIIKIDFGKVEDDWRNKKGSNPFDIWFQDSFGTFDKVKEETKKKTVPIKERLAMVPGTNLIERMEKLYIEELSKIKETYEKVCSIDPELAKEFDISIETIKSGLKEKLSGLKHRYWKELFDNLTKITDRLTSKSRDKLLSTLQNNIEVDFSSQNAYAIVIWAIKNANEYYDSQLVTCYESLVNKESCCLYKSNSHFTDDDWRFATNNSHYYLNDKLDYRIVTHRVGGFFNGESWRSYDNQYNLSNIAYDYIQDLITIAKNLGYDIDSTSLNTDWESGKERIFYTFPLMEKKKFMSVRAFKNGNLHFKFNQEFLRKFNVEFGRLKGWVNDKSQASEEMNIPMEEMNNLYYSNFCIEKMSTDLLIEKAV